MHFITWLALSFATASAMSPSDVTVSFTPSELRRTCELRLSTGVGAPGAYDLSARIPGHTSGWSPAKFHFFLRTRAYRGTNGAAALVEGAARARVLDERALVLQAFARGRSPIYPDLGASAAELRERWSAADRRLVDLALAQLRGDQPGLVIDVRWSVAGPDPVGQELRGYVFAPDATAPRGLLLVPELDEAHRYLTELTWRAESQVIHSALLPVTIERGS